MSNYCIYQVHFHEWAEKTFNLQHVDGTTMLSHASEHFGSYFDGMSLDLYKRGKDGDITRLPNDILRKHDNVILLRINNVQLKSIYRKRESTSGIPEYSEDKVESYPYSYVIIDNRPQICQIAIEKSPTWSSSTDNVRDILEEWFKSRMHDDYGLDITIDMKWQEAEFWDYVEERYHDFGDTITQMKFDIVNTKKTVPSNDSMIKPSGLVKTLVETTKLMGLLKSSFVMDMDDKSEVTNDTKFEDIAQMVRLCCYNSYSLSVTFKDYGEYKCTDLVRAMFKLENSVVNEFKIGEQVLADDKPTGEFELIRWLDKIQAETTNFVYGNKAPRKTKRKNKRLL